MALQGFWDFITGSAIPESFVETVICPPSASIKQMQAQLDELNQTWQSTGFYTWEEMSQMIAAVIKLAGQGSTAATRFFSGTSTPSGKDAVRSALERYNSIASRASDYTKVWQDARSEGAIIDAPGFRRWVLDNLGAGLTLMRTVEIETCQTPWWASVLVGFSSVFITIINIAKSIGKVIVEVGNKVRKAFDFVAWLLAHTPTILFFGALAGGGAYLYRRRKRLKPQSPVQGYRRRLKGSRR